MNSWLIFIIVKINSSKTVVICSVLCVIAILMGSCTPQELSVGSKSDPIPVSITTEEDAESMLPLAGLRSSGAFKLESFHYLDSLEPVMHDYYQTSRLMPFNLLLTDNGVGVNLNGYFLGSDPVLSKDGKILQFEVLKGPVHPNGYPVVNGSIWRMNAQGDLVCLAEGYERLYFADSSLAFAYIKDGVLYFWSSTSTQALDLGSVNMLPEGMSWTDRNCIVFSPNGETMMFENGQSLYSANSAGDIVCHAELAESYMLNGISDDGNILIYGRELYDYTLDELEQSRNCEMTILNAGSLQNSVSLEVGGYCYTLFNKDCSEIFFGSGMRFYIYSVANGLQQVNAPYNETSETPSGNVYEFLIHGENITNHSGGWPPKGLMYSYTETDHFTCYYFSDIGQDDSVVYYQPLSSATPIWQAKERWLVATSTNGNEALLKDNKDNYWLVNPDTDGDVEPLQVEPDDAQISWHVPERGSGYRFQLSNDWQELWMLANDETTENMLLWQDA